MSRAYRHADSWHVRGQFPTGTRVYDVQDERHQGRVDAFLDGKYRVTFDNGFRGDIPRARARKAEPEER